MLDHLCLVDVWFRWAVVKVEVLEDLIFVSFFECLGSRIKTWSMNDIFAEPVCAIRTPTTDGCITTCNAYF